MNWMRAREALLASPLVGPDIEKIVPILHEGLSDKAHENIPHTSALLTVSIKATALAKGALLPIRLNASIPDNNEVEFSPSLLLPFNKHVRMGFWPLDLTQLTDFLALNLGNSLMAFWLCITIKVLQHLKHSASKMVSILQQVYP
jgi:hypothetical protein